MTNFSRVERVDDKKGLLIWIELGLWLALLSPLQVVLLGHSANQVIGNVALMGLMAIHLAFGGNCLAAPAFAEATVVKKSAKSTERFEPRNTLNTRKWRHRRCGRYNFIKIFYKFYKYAIAYTVGKML